MTAFVSPTIEIRNAAKAIIGEGSFIEVFINTPIEVCEARDVKGLYAKARKGEIKDFTGINAPFEAPNSPELNILTEGKSPEENAEEIINFLIPKISLKE